MSLATISEDDESSDRSSILSVATSMPATFEGYCERVLQEEGVEIVAWGLFAPETEYESHEEEKPGIPIEDKEGAIRMITASNSSGDPPGSLSVLYQETDSKFIAFYRP